MEVENRCPTPLRFGDFLRSLHEIRIHGHVSSRLVSRFEGLTVSHELSGETVLVGLIRDQAALYGLPSWLQDMGVALLSVRRLDNGLAGAGDQQS
jgi:hypothetical protein